MAKEGWIKLHRKIVDNDIWKDKEPFDRRSAWIDLLIMANHKDEKILFDGELIVVKRGQTVTSVRKLAERWHWSKDKVQRFLDKLERDSMCDRDSNNRRTLLTIENYGVFQDRCDSNKDSECDSNKSQTINIKNIKKKRNNFADFGIKQKYDFEAIEKRLLEDG